MRRINVWWCHGGHSLSGLRINQETIFGGVVSEEYNLLISKSETRLAFCCQLCSPIWTRRKCLLRTINSCLFNHKNAVVLCYGNIREKRGVWSKYSWHNNLMYKKVPSKGTALWLLRVLHLKVKVRPSTRSKNSHLTVSLRWPLAPVWAEFFARCRRHYICALKNTHNFFVFLR